MGHILLRYLYLVPYARWIEIGTYLVVGRWDSILDRTSMCSILSYLCRYPRSLITIHIYPLSRPVYALPRLAVVLAIDGPTPTTGYSVASFHIMALYL